MKSTKLLFIAICAAVATSASAANFDTYLGKITTANIPVPVAGDTDGRLYYGTVNGPGSGLYVIEDPVSVIGQTTATQQGTTITIMTEFPTGRGPQGIQVTTTGTVFVSGDTGAGPVNIRKFDRTAVSPLTFTEDATFHTNVAVNPNRVGGCTIVSEADPGLLVGLTFNSINFFKFDGTASGLTNVFGGSARIYEREPVYNSRDNVIYAFKNGNLQSTMIDGYYGGFTPTAGGGSFTEAPLITDGSVNSQFGSSTQNGYFDPINNQLITCDTIANDSGTTQIRVWDVAPGGAALTLSYAIDNTLGGANWTNLGDAVVINNKLYVSSFGANGIFVYGSSSAVQEWKRFSAKK